MKSILLSLCFIAFGMNVLTAGQFSTTSEQSKKEIVSKVQTVNFEVTQIAADVTFEAQAQSTPNLYLLKNVPVTKTIKEKAAPKDVGWQSEKAITSYTSKHAAVNFNRRTC